MNPNLRPKRLVLAGAVAGSLITGAVVGATVFAPSLANAATSTPSPSGTGSSNSSNAAPDPAMPAHGSAAHENAETAVTGANATKAQAAAVKSVGSGTAGAVTTDYSKNGYEVTVTRADGTSVEVHLDSSFNVIQGHGGPNDHDPNGTPSGAPTN